MPLSTPAGCVGGGLASPRTGPESLEPREPGRPPQPGPLGKKTKKRAAGERERKERGEMAGISNPANVHARAHVCV